MREPCDVPLLTAAPGCVRARRAEVTERLARYVEARVGRLLKCLVADYLKDEFGQWWLLQVKQRGVPEAHVPCVWGCGRLTPVLA